jgi:hypothetical protein
VIQIKEDAAVHLTIVMTNLLPCCLGFYLFNMRNMRLQLGSIRIVTCDGWVSRTPAATLARLVLHATAPPILHNYRRPPIQPASP